MHSKNKNKGRVSFGFYFVINNSFFPLLRSYTFLVLFGFVCLVVYFSLQYLPISLSSFEPIRILHPILVISLIDIYIFNARPAPSPKPSTAANDDGSVYPIYKRSRGWGLILLLGLLGLCLLLMVKGLCTFLGRQGGGHRRGYYKFISVRMAF